MTDIVNRVRVKASYKSAGITCSTSEEMWEAAAEIERLLTALRRICSLEEKNVPKYAQKIASEALSPHPSTDVPAQQTGMLIAEWKAEARKHIAAALEDDAEVGGDEWFLHRESARIYDSCAKQLAALSPHPSTGREYDPNVAPCDDAEFGMKP